MKNDGTITFDVTRYFLIKGIDGIIHASKDADTSILNDIRCKFFSKGRNTTLSNLKRKELETLKGLIDQAEESSSDELSVGILGSYLTICQSTLRDKCRRDGYSEGATGEGLSILIQLLHAIHARLRMFGWSDIHYKGDPLQWFRFYTAMYRAQVLFDEHHAVIKFRPQIPYVIQGSEKDIIAHIDGCGVDIQALDEKKDGYKIAKIRLVTNRIQAVLNQLKLQEAWYVRIGEPIIGCSHLDHYMGLAMIELNGELATDLEKDNNFDGSLLSEFGV